MSNPQSTDTKECTPKDKNADTVDIYEVCHQLAPVVEKESNCRLLRKRQFK